MTGKADLATLGVDSLPGNHTIGFRIIMRIWNCCVSIIVLALAFTCWRFGDWTEHSPENEGMDGTCQGLQALLAYFLAAVLSALSIIPLFIRKHHIDRWNTPPEQRSKEGIITRPGRDYDRLFD